MRLLVGDCLPRAHQGTAGFGVIDLLCDAQKGAGSASGRQQPKLMPGVCGCGRGPWLLSLHAVRGPGSMGF